MIFSERPRAWAMHAMGRPCMPWAIACKVLLIETQKEAKKILEKIYYTLNVQMHALLTINNVTEVK